MALVSLGDCRGPWLAAATSVCSGFKVLVDGCDVQHDVLPVGPLSARHFIDVLWRRSSVRDAFPLPGHPNGLLVP